MFIQIFSGMHKIKRYWNGIYQNLRKDETHKVLLLKIFPQLLHMMMISRFIQPFHAPKNNNDKKVYLVLSC